MGCERRATTIQLKRGELSGTERSSALTHIRSCEDCRSELGGGWLLETLSTDGSDQATRAERRGGPRLWRPGPGAQVGHFAIGNRIGHGAFGLVFRAEDPSGGSVAVKVIPGDRCDDAIRRRFAREADALASVRHPGIVEVLAHGQTEDGGLYLATELLEGEDLAHRISRGPALPPDEAARVGVQAAEALGAAHVVGVVHRDVKPANLWLCSDGRVKVLDFGLAIRVAGDIDTRITASDVLIGTPAYMSPEQAQGAGGEDALTDVWGLGATLYHAVVGRTPFEGPTPIAQLVRVVSDEATPFPPGVPSWLRDVLGGALTKDRASRTSSMQAFARALSAGLAATGDRASPETDRTPSPFVALGDEVRIVSVLLAEEIDDFAAFAGAVRAEHGRAAPLIGRRGVGLFGGEAWRGDEAERAVRAGLAVRRVGGAGRLGVATGRAVRSLAHEITGEVVAAAEGALADVGVGADPETRRRTRGGFVLEGRAIVRTRPGTAVVGVRGLAGADVPIVGRSRELQDLVLSLDETIRSRQAQGVLVVGPPGIGKSRLRHALTARLADESRVVVYLEARGESHRSLEGWHAIANALRGWADAPEGTPAEQVQERLVALCPHRRCAELVAEMLGAPFAGTTVRGGARDDPHAMREQILVALGDLFESLTQRQPVLLAFEDVHLGDGPSLDVVDVLLRRLEDSPLFVLATSRTEGSAAEGATLPDLRRITLGGLSRKDTLELVTSVLGDAPDTAAHADAIYERSGGNPYFVEELALSVREGRTDLPTSVEAAVQARLDALPRRDKDLLRRASVLGRRFWAQAIAEMGEPDPAPVLQRLRRAELVAPEPRARLLGMTEWRFRHAIVQEVALASLTDDQRTALHRAAGAWLGARNDASPAEVAQHFDRAGATTDAQPFWRRAAERAFAEGDSTGGLEASLHALGRETDRAVAFRLRALRAEALQFLGRTADALAEVEALGELADTEDERAHVEARRARSLALRGEYEAAERVIDDALARHPDDPPLLVEKVWICCWSGRLEEGGRLAQLAADGATAGGDLVTTARALNALSQSLFQRGYVEQARGQCQRGLEVAEQSGDLRFIAAARGFLAYADLQLGRFESAVDGLEKARNLSRACDNRRNEAWALHNRGLALAWMGRIDEGLASERQALQIAREIEEARLADAASEYLAAILLLDGKAAEALAVIDEAVATRPPEVIRTEFRALRAEALGRLGRVDEARIDVLRALASRAEAGHMWEFEAELFLAAHRCDVPHALEEGLAALATRARRIDDPATRQSFLSRIPAHVRLLDEARAAGLDVDLAPQPG